MTKTKQERLVATARSRFLFAGGITVLMTAFVLFPNYREFVEKRSELAELKQSNIATETELEVERNNYRRLKRDYAKRADSDHIAIETIFPLEPHQTTIVRDLESYATKLSNPENPLTLKTVNFSKLVQTDKADYATLPIKVSISTTRENLKNFLSYFEHSGTITSESSAARRLLDVKNVDIRIADQNSQTGPSPSNLDVELTLTGYSAPTTPEDTPKK